MPSRHSGPFPTRRSQHARRPPPCRPAASRGRTVMRMRMQAGRRGSIVPLLALSVIGLLTLVALAADIGLVAVARNHCQNAADVGAMAGVRVLNGDSSNSC